MDAIKSSKLSAHISKPFDPSLCDDCQIRGYCIWKLKKEVVDEKIYSLKEFINQVPLRSPKPNLQKAYDAFHQDDYETAILLFRASLSNGNTEDGVYLGLALSYFFEKDYESASYYIYYFSNKLYGVPANYISSFIDICNENLNATFNEALSDTRPVYSVLKDTMPIQIS